MERSKTTPSAIRRHKDGSSVVCGGVRAVEVDETDASDASDTSAMSTFSLSGSIENDYNRQKINQAEHRNAAQEYFYLL